MRCALRGLVVWCWCWCFGCLGCLPVGVLCDCRCGLLAVMGVATVWIVFSFIVVLILLLWL